MPALELYDRPRLVRRARLRFDRKSRNFLLLFPEHGLILNDSAAEILLACSGSSTIEQIVSQLSQDGDEREAVLLDTLEFLSVLRRRRLIALAGEPA